LKHTLPYTIANVEYVNMQTCWRLQLLLPLSFPVYVMSAIQFWLFWA